MEQIARRAIGRETINHVANINKYYIAYKLVFGLSEKRKHALEAIKPGGKN